ncbi:hypothetical protein HWV62_39966 [Athelia sp. TMB]|nr:hypothetical protein HWV62_39966 [Athelia sp. TMB]
MAVPRNTRRTTAASTILAAGSKRGSRPKKANKSTEIGTPSGDDIIHVRRPRTGLTTNIREALPSAQSLGMAFQNETDGVFTFSHPFPRTVQKSLHGAEDGELEEELDYSDGAQSEYSDEERSNDDSSGQDWDAEDGHEELLDYLEDDDNDGDLGIYRDDLYEYRLDQLEATFNRGAQEDRLANLGILESTAVDGSDDDDEDFKPNDDSTGDEDDLQDDVSTYEADEDDLHHSRKRRRSQPAGKKKKRRVLSTSPTPTSPSTSPPSPTAHHPDLPTTSALTHEYGSVHCSCTTQAHAVDISLSPDSPEHLDVDCAFLRLLELKFHRFHRLLICSCSGGSFVSMSELLKHYRTRHPGLLIGESKRDKAAGKRCSARHRKTFEGSVLLHFSQCFSVDLTQPRVYFTTETFRGPIHGLADASEYPKCPSCDYCGLTQDALRFHHKRFHGSQLETDDVQLRLCQQPFGDRGGNRLPRLILVPRRLEASPSTAEQTPVDSGETLPQPYEEPEGSGLPASRWLASIGWHVWVQELIKLGWKAAELVALVAPPRRIGNALKYPQSGSKHRILDWALCLIGRRFTKMAEDANTWLSTSSPEVRVALSEGSRSRFRPIKSKSYRTYAVAIRRPVNLALRLKLRTSKTPSLGIVYTPQEIRAIDALYDFIFNPSVDLYANGEDDFAYSAQLELYKVGLDARLHSILEAFIYRRLNPTRFMGCILNTALALSCLNKNAAFKTGSQCTQRCAAYRYYFRTTVTNTIRLHMDDRAEYVAPLSTSLVGDEEEEVEDFDKAEKFEKKFLELTLWLKPGSKGQSTYTPATYTMNTWLFALSDSNEERSKVQLMWNERCSGFQYLRPGVLQVDIEINQIRQMVHSMEGKMEETITKLFPPTMPFSRAMNLPWKELQPSATVTSSFLDAKEPWEQWRQSAVNELTRAYQQLYGSSLADFKNLLILDKEFQTLLVGIIIGNTGVPPRGSTLREFAYRTSSNYKLNLFLKGTALTLVGGRQKMDTRAPGIRDSVLRAFSPQVARLLTVYLGLNRQAIVEVMRSNAWHMESLDAYNTMLFATYHIPKKNQRKAHNGCWSMIGIVSAWHECSEPHLGAKLSLVDMRQLVTGVYGKLFPGVLYAPDVHNTAAILQGDHSATTTWNHYGRNHQQANGMSEPDAQSYIQVSSIWHAFSQTAPVNPSWPQDVLQSICFNPEVKQGYALKLASHLVMPIFMSAGSPAEVKSILQDLLNSLPFILTQKRNFHLSSSMLQTTVAALAFGPEGAQPGSVLPRGPEDVADAAVLLVRALDSWTDGSNLRTVDSESATARYNKLRTFVQDSVLNLIEECESEWVEFMSSVKQVELPTAEAYKLCDLMEIGL